MDEDATISQDAAGWEAGPSEAAAVKTSRITEVGCWAVQTGPQSENGIKDRGIFPRQREKLELFNGYSFSFAR